MGTQKLAPVPEGKGEPLKMGKQWASFEHRTLKETCIAATTLSNPLCTSLSSAKGLSDPFVGIPGAQGTDNLVSTILTQLQLPNCSRILRDCFGAQQKGEHTVSCLCIKNMKVHPKIPQLTNLLSVHVLCTGSMHWELRSLTDFHYYQYDALLRI